MSVRLGACVPKGKKPGEVRRRSERKTVNMRAIIKITTFITQMFVLNFARLMFASMQTVEEYDGSSLDAR